MRIFEGIYWVKIIRVKYYCDRANCNHWGMRLDHVKGESLSPCGLQLQYITLERPFEKCPLCGKKWIFTEWRRRTCSCAKKGKHKELFKSLCPVSWKDMKSRFNPPSFYRPSPTLLPTSFPPLIVS